MPTISMFYGIIIRMYALDTQQHHLTYDLKVAQTEMKDSLLAVRELAAA